MRETTGIFLIGGSAGSIKVILKVLPNLVKPKFPILIILHRAPSAQSVLQDLFSSYTDVPVFEIEDKTVLEPGNIYVAPADYHLLIEQDRSVTLDYSEKLNYSRPSIDVTFISAAQVYKENTFGLLLSGANEDGVKGLSYIKSQEGTVLVQDPGTCEVDYMPQQAIHKVAVDLIMKPEEIATFVNKLSGL